LIPSETRYLLDRGFPPRLATGEGTAHVVSGWCFHPEKQLRRIIVDIGGTHLTLPYIRELRIDVAAAFAAEDPRGHSILSGFWGTLPITPDRVHGTYPVQLVLEWRDGTTETHEIGSSTFERQQTFDRTGNCLEGLRPAVVICLPTFNPDLVAFEQQVASLIAQTVTDWICIVSDDGSKPEAYEGVSAICRRDPRFQVFRNETNLGFYHNYERTLITAATLRPSFVALSDQDDRWYPNKLERCLAAFDNSTSLVYCDMKVVDPGRKLISDTYWFGRRNNYTDSDVVFLANTVTGAASVFRGELLQKILPFPDRVGDCFHDHWIACCALAAGRLGYVDEALYEYVQHRDNVIGHCSLEGRSWMDGFKPALARLFSGEGWRPVVRTLVLEHVAFYTQEYRRLELFAQILKLRFASIPSERLRALQLADGTWASVARLGRAHLRYWLTGATTGDAEIRLGTGFIVTRIANRIVGLFRRYLIRRVRKHLREGRGK
jgi:glycosyltransferase involved in cell wall biosynthesis